MSDRMRASYVALVAALRAEFGPAALEAMRIQLIPHRHNPTSLSVLVQAVGDARDVTFATVDIELAAEDTTAIQPCQPIGCDNGYHLAGCRFADIDAAEHSGTEASKP